MVAVGPAAEEEDPCILRHRRRDVAHHDTQLFCNGTRNLLRVPAPGIHQHCYIVYTLPFGFRNLSLGIVPEIRPPGSAGRYGAGPVATH
jgi:hypothetical protein